MKIKGGRILHKMSELNGMLTADEITKMSKNYGFDANDEFFHFDKEENFLESLNTEDVEEFNRNVSFGERLLVA